MTQLSQIFRASLCGAILLLCMGACSKDLMPGLSVGPETTTDQSAGGTVPVTVTPIEDIAGGIDTTQLDEGAGVVVRFSKGAGEFAFDAAEQDWYRRALLVRDKYEAFGEGYIAPWKLVPVGENDTVEAVIAEGKAKPEDISFVLKDGTGVPAKENGGKWTLTLPSVGSGEEYPVFAVLKKRNGNLTVGKLNVVSYPKQTRMVTLVPVFERFSDVGAVERELNAIYAPYGVTFSVAEDNSMIGVWDWDLDGDGALNLDGSGFFSNETDEMKALRKAYQSAGNYDRNGYYLFVMREAKADTEPEFTAAGDMPRGKQFGYLFSADPGPSLSRLAAHELGHGIFTLTHTFDSNYGGGDSRAQTPNLMDYADGTDLGAFQWSVIAKPAPLTWFDNEEDGMSYGDIPGRPLCIADAGIKDRLAANYQYYYMPNGKVIDLRKMGYKPSGFFPQSDSHVEGRGALAAITDGVYDFLHRYVADTEITVGYGGVENLDDYVVTDPELISQAVHVFIDTTNIIVERDGVEIERIVYDGNCGCTPKPNANEIYFQTSKISEEYVKYVQEHPATIKMANAFGVDSDVYKALSGKIDEQINTQYKDGLLGEALVDKLRTYEQFNEGRKFIVAISEVNTLSVSQDTWQALAQSLFDDKGLDGDDILITLPYIKCAGIGPDQGEIYFMPGLAHGGNVQIDLGKLRRDYSNTQGNVDFQMSGMESESNQVRNFVADVFKYTTKKALVYVGVFLANNTVEFTTEFKDNVGGYTFNKTIQLYTQTGIDELIELIADGEKHLDEAQRGMAGMLSSPKGSALYMEYHRVLAEIRYQNSIARLEKIEDLSKSANDLISYIPTDPIIFREEFLEAPNDKAESLTGHNMSNGQFEVTIRAFDGLRDQLGYDNAYSAWSGRPYSQDHTLTNMTDWYFSQYVDKYVYGTLDALSVILGIAGWDVAPEGIALLYASVRGDAFRATGYGIGLIIVGSGGAAVKGTVNFGGAKFVGVTRNGDMIAAANVEDEILRAIVRKNQDLFPNGAGNRTGAELKKYVDDILNGADNLLDDIYDTQKAIVNQSRNSIATASNNAKGAFGEIGSDVFLTERGYSPLHNRKLSLDEGWGESGIDGVFIKDGQYYIVEAKYHGTARLTPANEVTGLPKQMSDEWIRGNDRLIKAVGNTKAQEILDAGYKRLLAETAPDGTVVYKELDGMANEIGAFIP